MRSIAACLWFDNQAEEAAAFYTSIFPDSEVVRTARFPKAGFEIHGRPEGSVMEVEFSLGRQRFTALNGGPHFTFNEAVSFQIFCETQDEIDHYWDKLGEGGDPAAQQCGWLKDRFGVSWQVIPARLPEMMCDPDVRRVEAVMDALLRMKKLEIAGLERAYQEAAQEA